MLDAFLPYLRFNGSLLASQKDGKYSITADLGHNGVALRIDCEYVDTAAHIAQQLGLGQLEKLGNDMEAYGYIDPTFVVVTHTLEAVKPRRTFTNTSAEQ